MDRQFSQKFGINLLEGFWKKKKVLWTDGQMMDNGHMRDNSSSPEQLHKAELKIRNSNFNKRPMGHDTLLKNQIGHRPMFQKLHIHSLSTPGRRGGGLNCTYFALRATISEIRADFQNCHIWAWNLAIGQSSRSCTYATFYPRGVEIELIFTLRAVISEI